MITIIIKINYINNGENNDDNDNDKTSNKSPLHQVVSNLHFFNHPSSFAAAGASEACFFEELRHAIIFGLAHGEHTWAPKNGGMAPGGEGAKSTWVISHVPMFHITQPLDSIRYMVY